jgi:hypothetical protein
VTREMLKDTVDALSAASAHQWRRDQLLVMTQADYRQAVADGIVVFHDGKPYALWGQEVIPAPYMP